MTLRVEPGQMVAIVGSVASGKTTLANGLLSLLRAPAAPDPHSHVEKRKRAQ